MIEEAVLTEFHARSGVEEAIAEAEKDVVEEKIDGAAGDVAKVIEATRPRR